MERAALVSICIFFCCFFLVAIVTNGDGGGGGNLVTYGLKERKTDRQSVSQLERELRNRRYQLKYPSYAITFYIYPP